MQRNPHNELEGLVVEEVQRVVQHNQNPLLYLLKFFEVLNLVREDGLLILFTKLKQLPSFESEIHPHFPRVSQLRHPKRDSPFFSSFYGFWVLCNVFNQIEETTLWAHLALIESSILRGRGAIVRRRWRFQKLVLLRTLSTLIAPSSHRGSFKFLSRR